MPETYTPDDFRRIALSEFPVLREDFEDYEGLPHLQMAALAHLTQRAKGEGDWDTYARCIRIADELWRRPNPELLNALNVSFLEHLDFEGKNGQRAWELLTPPLQRGWQAVEEYWEEMRRAKGQTGRKKK